MDWGGRSVLCVRVGCGFVRGRFGFGLRAQRVGGGGGFRKPADLASAFRSCRCRNWRDGDSAWLRLTVMILRLPHAK